MESDEPFRIDAREVGRAEVRDEDHLVIDRQRLRKKSFGPRKLSSMAVIESKLKQCSFDDLVVEHSSSFGSGVEETEFVECTFDRSQFLWVPSVGRARFVRCSFRNVRIKHWTSRAHFVDCYFSGTADNCSFWGFDEDYDAGVRSPIRFEGNDFSEMRFRNVDFRGGIDLRRQRLPQGEDYVYLEAPRDALTNARRAVAGWADDERRRDALTWIDVFEDWVDMHDQEQLHFAVADLVDMEQEAAIALAVAMRGTPA